MSLITLCYHKVGPQEIEGRRLNIDPKRLDSHVRYFRRRGFAFVKARDLAEGSHEKTVCFTFDDGFESTFVYGTPVFDRYGLPMTVYAVSSLVGQASAWEGELARPLATWDRLIEASRAGHEIGNHTASHPRLGELDLEKQVQEIEACDAALRAHGLEPGSFCYPYGSLNEESLVALRHAGHQVGMALGKRLPRAEDPKIKLPRVVVAFSDALPMLLYKLYVRSRLKK